MALRAAVGLVALGLVIAVPAAAALGDSDDGWLLLIRSDSACPDAAAVDRRTRDLLGLGAEVTLRESVDLAHEGTGLSVKLRGEDQRPLGERVLPLDEDCDALARAVSVVLASWLTDAHPEFLAASPAPSAAIAPVRAPSHPAPPPAPSRMVARVAARGVLRVDTRLRFRPTVGIGVVADTHGVAPAGMVGLGVAPAGSGLGAAVRLVPSLERRQPLGEGELGLRRQPLALGAVLRVEGAALSGELHAGAALAWLQLQGHGFGRDRTVNDLALGLYGAVRVSFAFGQLEPFLDVCGFAWPGAGSAFVDPPDPGVPLARGELVPVLGVAYRL